MPCNVISWVVILMTVSLSATAQFKLYEKGHSSYTNGQYGEAIRNFSEYLTKPTRDKALDVEVYYLRALSYYKTNDYKNAVLDFEETILLGHKNLGNIYWFKAKCHDNIGANDDAISSYSNAIRELESKPEVKAKLLYERSMIFAKTGNSEKAYADLKAGEIADPTNTDIKRELAKSDKQTNTIASKPESNNSNQIILASQSSLADIYKDERRFALVIGNSAYPQNIGVLKNPVNDAIDITMELRNSGFQVDLLTDATYGQMRAALLKFKEKVDAGDREKTVALFYFAGHGVQHDDENYLIPIDAIVEFEDDIPRYCFPTQRMVLANMERSNSRMNIVILDACRNNPFPALNRSVSQGLGEMRRARGSFIAYATAPGSVASDGSGRNGLYTQELLKAMRKPGLTIEQVFKEVRANVLKLSGDRQNTWDSSNITGEFYFKF
ncbi:MAG TPA: caspase family protein [Ohtaekwangia sp.]